MNLETRLHPMRRAFVSHATADDSYVAEMESFLRAAGFDDVFNDVSSIRPDEKFWPEIEKGIRDSDAFVVVITAASNSSDWVKREVECARNLSKKVIPVWIEDCPVPAIFQGHDVIDFRPRSRKERRLDISRIVKYAPAELVGREAETELLAEAWQKTLRLEKGRPRVLTFVALGGEGKTALVAKWAAELAARDWPGCDAAFAWSFYSQGTREQQAASSDLFLKAALTFFAELEAEKERERIKAFAASNAGAYEKGQRLASIIGSRHCLLILDGLEPLQYAPTSPTPGHLKDQGIEALLKSLAQNSQGLCLVTTRYSLPDLMAFTGSTVVQRELKRLSREAGVQLLKAHGVHGSDRRTIPLKDGDETSEKVSEFEKLVEDVDGHALTLHIMGSYLKKAFKGDIRRRDRVTFAKASARTDRDHAMRAMGAYAKWMEDGSDEAKRELAILRLMGLFDRPADAGCLAALLETPAIPGLTDPLVGLAEEDWNASLDSLESAKLLTVSTESVSLPNSHFPLPTSLDAHPLLREHFARELRAPTGRNKPAQGNALGPGVPISGSPEGAAQGAGVSPHQGLGDSGAAVPGALPQAGFSRPVGAEPGTETSEAWRAAHRRLYEHLCASTKESDAPTLEDLQPLYQAVAHGCQAGLQQAACDEIYFARIKRRDENYSSRRLGAFGSDLGAVACFFDEPWKAVSSAVTEADQAWLLNEAAFGLRALGRLTEAVEAQRANLKMRVERREWQHAPSSASNLSELELTLGEVAGAVGDAEQSVTYADRSGDAFERIINRTTHADALHQAGRRAEAETRFREAEQMQQEMQPDYPLLYSLQGFKYCDLLLAAPERAAWQRTLRSAAVSERPAAAAPPRQDVTANFKRLSAAGLAAGGPEDPPALLEQCRSVSQRAAQTLKWAEMHGGQGGLLDPALNHLTLGRAALYAAILSDPRRAELHDAQTSSSELKSGTRVTRPSDLLEDARRELDAAVSGLRRAGQQFLLVQGLLTRAWLRAWQGKLIGPESAQEDLDEAWEIAERGPMRLFMADVHLFRARLFGSGNFGIGTGREGCNYPWDSPAADLAAARKLIQQCGYGRRNDELADAEEAAKRWPKVASRPKPPPAPSLPAAAE